MDMYGFFENFSYYNGHAVKADGKNSVVIKDDPEFPEEYMCPEFAEKSCYYFLINNVFPSIENPHIICEKFKHIYNLLSNHKGVSKKEGTLENNDWAFLNYWLNEKLRGTNTHPSICVKDFYEKLREIDKDYFKIASTDNKLFNMKKHDFENMKKLYELYNIKNKNSETMVPSISQKESALCFVILTDLKNKYRDEFTYYTEFSISCKSKEIFELPEYETVLKEHKSRPFSRTIALPVLFPLLGITPFRQMVLEKIKRTKNMLFDVGESDEKLLSYTSNNDNISEDQLVYNISYYSA
ncbi:PIR Superfamily Protein [Plasmodium ovale wallikeri]|uniref:PIR Superfamily Protein n=1 Tax=Plasmodium ovale wallikeri TaxID=864142 RepID=A0A1A9AHI4_PLAOA|nr:PIR Superfamily Protein [Plasmodium ovale wallikeri]